MDTRRFWSLLLLAGLLGLGIRGGMFLAHGRGEPLTGDGAFYHETANLLADGKGYINPFIYNLGYCPGPAKGHGNGDRTYEFLENQTCATYEVTAADGTITTETVRVAPGTRMPTAAHPPMWSFVLSIESRLGLDSVDAHRALGVLFGALGVVLIGLAGRELFGDRVGVTSAFVAAVYGFLWLNDWSLMSEPLVTVFVPIVTIVAVRWWRSPSWRFALGLGVLSGLGGLLRSELLAYGPLLVLVALVLRRREWRTVGRDVVIVVVATTMVLAPWVMRNLTTFAVPVYLSPTGTLLSQTNCDATYYGEKIGYWERTCSEPEPIGPNGEFLDEAQRDQIRREWATDYISHHRKRWLLVAVPARIGRMFNLWDPIQTARFDIYVEGRDFRWSMVALAEYYAVVVGAIAGVLLAWRRRLVLAPVLLWPTLLVLTAATSFGNNRYRVSAEPALIWLSSLALASLVERRRHTNRTTNSITTESTAVSPS